MANPPWNFGSFASTPAPLTLPTDSRPSPSIFGSFASKPATITADSRSSAGSFLFGSVSTSSTPSLLAPISDPISTYSMPLFSTSTHTTYTTDSKPSTGFFTCASFASLPEYSRPSTGFSFGSSASTPISMTSDSRSSTSSFTFGVSTSSSPLLFATSTSIFSTSAPLFPPSTHTTSATDSKPFTGTGFVTFASFASQPDARPSMGFATFGSSAASTRDSGSLTAGLVASTFGCCTSKSCSHLRGTNAVSSQAPGNPFDFKLSTSNFSSSVSISTTPQTISESANVAPVPASNSSSVVELSPETKSDPEKKNMSSMGPPLQVDEVKQNKTGRESNQVSVPASNSPPVVELSSETKSDPERKNMSTMGPSLQVDEVKQSKAGRESNQIPVSNSPLPLTMVSRILNGIPQRPHFYQLQNCSEITRNNLIIAWDQIFEETVKEIHCLHDVDHFWVRAKELWKTMEELHNVGYNVIPLRKRLLELTDVMMELKSKKAEIKRLKIKAENHRMEKSRLESVILNLQAMAKVEEGKMESLLIEAADLEDDLPEFGDLFAKLAMEPLAPL